MKSVILFVGATHGVARNGVNAILGTGRCMASLLLFDELQKGLNEALDVVFAE